MKFYADVNKNARNTSPELYNIGAANDFSYLQNSKVLKSWKTHGKLMEHRLVLLSQAVPKFQASSGSKRIDNVRHKGHGFAATCAMRIGDTPRHWASLPSQSTRPHHGTGRHQPCVPCLTAHSSMARCQPQPQGSWHVRRGHRPCLTRGLTHVYMGHPPKRALLEFSPPV